MEDWANSLIEARHQTTHAIVIFSDDYMTTDYCIQEYQYFLDAGIPIIAVIATDISVTDLSDRTTVVDWIDFRKATDDISFKRMVKYTLELLKVEPYHATHSERQYYLLSLIERIENDLVTIPTSRAVYHDDAGAVRSRGYDLQVLTDWHLVLENERSTLDIENVLSWYDAQSQFVLSGKAGSGKTVIAQLLTLWGAHQALTDSTKPLPFWFDLALWTPEQSVELFFESQWPLEFYFRQWLDTYEALLIFDNWTDFNHIHPDYVFAFNKYLETLSEHKLIILAQDTKGILPNIEVVTINNMPDHKIQRLARSFLSDIATGNFKRLVAQNRTSLARKHIDFIACGIELVALDGNKASETWFKNPVISLIELRWEAQPDTFAPSFSLNYFIKTMRLLAWQMMQQSHHRLLDFEKAVELVYQVEAVQVGIQLGILSVVGNYVRFHAEMYQWYLATQHLAQDGLYKYLTHPEFTEQGQRQASLWDDVIFALISSVAENRQQQLLDQIAEIDPYLAWECMQQIPELYNNYLRVIIAKLIEFRSSAPHSELALLNVLQQIDDVEQLAYSLLEELAKYDWGMQQWLWAEVTKLPIEVPSSFVDQVTEIERENTETVSELLNVFPLTKTIVYLAHLLIRPFDTRPGNVIWLVGELKQHGFIIGLFELLEQEEVITRREILRTLSKLSHPQLITKLLLWLDQHPEHGGDIGQLLRQQSRYVSGQLLLTLFSNDIEIDGAVRNAIIKYNEEDIAWTVASYIMLEIPDTELSEKLDTVKRDENMNVQKLLQASLDRLPRGSFNNLIDDVQRIITTPASSILSVGQTSEGILFQRAQSAVASVRPADATTDATHAVADDLTHQLRNSDWLVRQKATEQLANLSHDVALPLLLNSAKDSDIKVRLTAYSLLAKYHSHESAQNTLIEALSDEDAVIVDTVADLFKTNDIIDEATTVSLLNSDNIQQVAAVMDILSTKRYPQSVQALVAYLNDDRKPWMDKTLGEYAQDALLAIGTPEAMDAIQPLQESRVDVISAQTVTKSQKKKSYTKLEKIKIALKIMRGDDWGKAQKSARFLREYCQKLENTDDLEIVYYLCDELSDDDWNIRWAITEALAWLKHPYATPYLIERLEDSSWIVQVAAIHGLVELEAKTSASKLVDLLDSDYEAVRETSAKALGQLGNIDSVTYLEKSFENGDDFLRLACLQSIHTILGDAGIEKLRMGLRDGYMHIRWYAIKHLVSHFTESDLRLLAQLLLDDGHPPWEDKSICDYAYEALFLIDTAKSHKIIANWNKQKM